MEKINWSTFKKRISINQNIEIIFKSWSSQEELEKWFLSKAEFYTENNLIKDRTSNISNNDSYEWMWHGSDIVANGKIFETNNKDYIKFSFYGCTVEVSIFTEEDENIIALSQSNIPLDEISRMNYFVGCSGGWTFYLTNLKSILEGGIDLRNRNSKLREVINT